MTTPGARTRLVKVDDDRYEVRIFQGDILLGSINRLQGERWRFDSLHPSVSSTSGSFGYVTAMMPRYAAEYLQSKAVSDAPLIA